MPTMTFNHATAPTASDPIADRRRWTQDDCRKLEALEVLTPGTYELIEGDIIEKMGQNEPHLFVNTEAFYALAAIFGRDYVRLPGPMNVNANNSPEPDVAVTRLPRRDYLQRGTPTPADMRLIVEVSDSTLWRDRNTKAKIYAAAGVPDYWVIDLNHRKLWVYRSPSATGYATPSEFDENGSVAPLDAPQNPIRVGDLLP